MSNFKKHMQEQIVASHKKLDDLEAHINKTKEKKHSFRSMLYIVNVLSAFSITYSLHRVESAFARITLLTAAVLSVVCLYRLERGTFIREIDFLHMNNIQFKRDMLDQAQANLDMEDDEDDTREHQ